MTLLTECSTSWTDQMWEFTDWTGLISHTQFGFDLSAVNLLLYMPTHTYRNIHMQEKNSSICFMFFIRSVCKFTEGEGKCMDPPFTYLLLFIYNSYIYSRRVLIVDFCIHGLSGISNWLVLLLLTGEKKWCLGGPPC